MKKYLMLVWILIQTIMCNAQGFRGTVVDADTKQGVPFANVYISTIQAGTVCDFNGNFFLSGTVPEQVQIKVTAQFYETVEMGVQTFDFVTIELHQYHVHFDDIVVSGPVGGSIKENAFKIDRLRLKDLNSLQSSSLGEAIANINGVQEASFGAGVSKPVIRGMQGVRLITMLNGMRLENQQWGGDHGMAVNQLGIDAVEIIKGPSSLLYGADAFGGVVYLVDAPYNQQNSYQVSAGTKFESVNLGSSSVVGLKLAKGAVRFNLDGLFSDYADFKVPNGMYAANTRYGEQGLKTSIGINKKNWVAHLRYTYSQNHTGIPGHVHEESEEEEEHDEIYGETPERIFEAPVIVGTNHLVSIENRFYFGLHEIRALIGHTENDTREFEEEVGFPAMQMNLSNTPYSANARWQLTSNWVLHTGVQGMYQMNRNRKSAPEQLIPDYNQMDNGVFSLLAYKKDFWHVQFGGRFDARQLIARSADYDNVFLSPNFAAGIVRNTDLSTFRFNTASGFRAPHLSELLSDGAHEGAIRYEIGNVNLKSEQSFQVDLSYELHREHFEWIFNPFYNYITNYIYLENQNMMIDSLPVYEYTQAAEANLYGVDLGLHYHPHFAHFLHIESSYSYVRGEDFKGNGFSMMPQARINSLFRFNFSSTKKFRVNEVSLQHQYYFPQMKLDDFETPSIDYHLIHAGMDLIWDIKTPVVIGVGVKNVLNQRYINHLSRLKNIGLESPGRNFYISLKMNINGKFH